jgi:hypothetical protein
MRDVLVAVRRLALGAVVVSAIALPLGAFLVASRSIDGGANGLGAIIAFSLGLWLLGIGVTGLIFGSGLALLAKRALDDPAAVGGTRRLALATGLTVAGGELLLSVALGGLFSLAVGLSAALAAAYFVVAAASLRSGQRAIAGVLGVVLLTLGLVPLWGQLELNGGADRMRDRTALLPADMDVGIDAGAAAAPDGWAVAVLVAKGTNIGASTSRDLPDTLIGQPLRGLVIVDCAGPAELEVLTMDDLAATIVVGSIPCRAEPQVLTFAIPGVADHAMPPAYVARISVDPVPNDGSIDALNRAMILVALAAAPDPSPDALLASFSAAYGTDRPR